MGGSTPGPHVGRILDWVIAREVPANPTKIAGSNPAEGQALHEVTYAGQSKHIATNYVPKTVGQV
jgi:hypothetical protein